MTIIASIALALGAASGQAQDVEVEVIKVEQSPHYVMVVQLADTREETAAMAAERFERRDRDGNGVVEGDERHITGWEIPHHPMPPLRPIPPMDLDKMFDAIDSDGDGTLSRVEFLTHHAGHTMHGEAPGEHRLMVQRIVRGDGGNEVEVTVDDEATWTDDGGKTVALEMIEQLAKGEDEDADGDGRVTRDEAIASALARFDALDSNGNGTLDEED